MSTRWLPRPVQAGFHALDAETQRAFQRDLKQRRKSLGTAYITWLVLGWHYLYLGRILMQLAFWGTLGGFFVWWLIDFFRLPGIVRRHNEDMARQLMVEYRACLSR